MILDTSALLAVALAERHAPRMLEHIEAATRRLISAVSVLEAGIVLRARLGPAAIPLLFDLLERLGSQVVPFDESQANLAITAFIRFGKGMGHRAQLNFGDCAVYALAISRGESVLATGNDFAATDIHVLR